MCNFHTVGEIFLSFESGLYSNAVEVVKTSIIYAEAVLKCKKQISGHFDMKTATYKMHHQKVIEDKQTCVKSFNTLRGGCEYI